MDQRPCLITAPHSQHPWTPIVVDPEDDHTLHVFTDLPLLCPGIATADWLATR